MNLPLWAAAAITATNLAGLALAAARLRRRHHRPATRKEGVTIVRPVCGLEPNIEATLASGFALEHPDLELIFCLDHADDPVRPLVERLIAAHPNVQARLLIGENRHSGNPKLNNCIKGWDAARHDWIILADSNVLMPPDYVEQLFAAWRPDTGLVCSTPLGSQPANFWAEVECAFLNTLQARWQYTGEALGLGFAQGKSMLWQRDFLDAHGGIRALAAEIAEDAAATKLVRRAGRRVHLVNSPFEQPLGSRTARQVWLRQLRWARLRRVTFPLFFAPEVLIGAAVPTMLAAIAAGPAALLVPLLWYGAEAALAWRKGWPLSWQLLAAMPVRDVMILGVWAMGWTTGTTVWRGNALPLREKRAV
ncbi:ceramide glucosyltransferase [Roseomonas populi]|uniref:Ceramide glucosyltransferase n=1 Tax=Roseomonas populi TaxID=3121582 RepID=A0ABT1X764_9PROT|nr:ceramide glucosyltransferase [Roseomonas pecuniae]MCR0983946.1 ceramide glucosyltransferase [Roseomonas pecuniae]